MERLLHCRWNNGIIYRERSYLMKKSELTAAIDVQAVERKKRLGMPRMALPNVPSERKFATVVSGVRRFSFREFLRFLKREAAADACRISMELTKRNATLCEKTVAAHSRPCRWRGN